MADARPVFDKSQPLAVRQDHNCFGCGRLNEHGLKLSFFVDPDESVWCDWIPYRKVEGWQNIVHGGLITTVLDEVMGWRLSSQHIWAVTARLNVSFRKPVEIGVPVRARSWIVTDHGRRLDVAAEILRTSDGVRLADAEGVFVRVSQEMSTEWEKRYFG